MGKEKSYKEPVTFRYHDHDCVLQLGRYKHGGRVAMTVLDKETREELTMATVNLPEVPLRPEQTFIKDYSENEGLLRALCDARVVMSTGDYVESGFVRIPKCMFIVPVPERFREGALLTRTVPPEMHRDRELGREP